MEQKKKNIIFVSNQQPTKVLQKKLVDEQKITDEVNDYQINEIVDKKKIKLMIIILWMKLFNWLFLFIFIFIFHYNHFFQNAENERQKQ